MRRVQGAHRWQEHGGERCAMRSFDGEAVLLRQRANAVFLGASFV